MTRPALPRDLLGMFYRVYWKLPRGGFTSFLRLSGPLGAREQKRIYGGKLYRVTVWRKAK